MYIFIVCLTMFTPEHTTHTGKIQDKTLTKNQYQVG